MKPLTILLITVSSVLLWGCDEYLYDHPGTPAQGDDERGLVIAPASDGYFVAGQKFYAGSNSDFADLYFAFFDEDGYRRWTDVYATDLDDEPLAARETNDRGFLILAERASPSQSPVYYILKLDPDGRVEWRHDISSGGLYRVVDAEATRDGGFILLGSGSADEGTTLLKTSSQGDIMFRTSYGGHHTPVDVSELGSGFVILSNADHRRDSSTVSLIRTDNWGGLVWANLVWSPDDWQAWHIAENPDASLFIVAELASGTTASTPLLIKTDPYGHYLWADRYGEVSGARINAVVCNYNGLLLAGELDNGHRFDAFAMRANDHGDWYWWQTYGDSDNDWISDAVSGNRGGYVLTGALTVPGGDTDLYLTKISSDGVPFWSTSSGE